MSSIFKTIFLRPLINVFGMLVFILPHNSFGGAIIVMVVLVNLLLLPVTHRMKHSQRKLQEIQPHLANIKKRYKDNKEEQARKMLELYREHGINPFSSFLGLFIQLPVFIALLRIFSRGANFEANMYSFLPIPPHASTPFLGIVDLGSPNIVLTFIAAVAQFIQGTFLMPKTPKDADTSDFARIMQGQMRYVIPFVIFFVGSKLPSALSLCWTTISIFGIVHELIVRRYGARSATTQRSDT